MKELLQKIEVFTDRRSVRKFTSQPVPQESLAAAVTAGLAAPSAKNRRPVHFVTLTDPATIQHLSQGKESAAWLASAPAAIVVCGNLMEEADHDLLLVDAAAAAENVLLACHAVGLGSTWIGVLSDSPWEKDIQTQLQLPNDVLPVAVIGIGHPAETPTADDRFEATRIHQNKW